LRILIMTSVVLVVLIRPAIAQEAGDPLKGAAYAREHCVECHTIEGDEQLSPLPKAPTFKAVANSPGMTATALLVWFRTPHPSMPNLIINTEDQRNLAAYIISLRQSR
jgi:mono/diheme cytochrome c family protein